MTAERDALRTALWERAHVADAAAALAAARARVWRRAAEVAAKGGDGAARILRLVASGAVADNEDPAWLARMFGLVATQAEAEAWLGRLPGRQADLVAAVTRSAEACRDRALARAGRAEGSGFP